MENTLKITHKKKIDEAISELPDNLKSVYGGQTEKPIEERQKLHEDDKGNSKI